MKYISSKKILPLFTLIFFTSLWQFSQAAEVTLAWTPNTETNLGGYKIYSGSSSRTYSGIMDVRLPDIINGQVVVTLTNFSPGSTIFFSATAYELERGFGTFH